MIVSFSSSLAYKRNVYKMNLTPLRSVRGLTKRFLIEKKKKKNINLMTKPEGPLHFLGEEKRVETANASVILHLKG